MTQKPSYEELEQMVKALEKEVVQLKLVEEQLNIAIDRSPIPTAMGGSDGSIIAYNEALENLIGYKRSEIKDVTVWAKKLYPDEKYRDFVWKNISQALEGKEQDCTEFTITCNDGSTKVVDFKTSFFQGGLIIQMIDITDRKRAEEALLQERDRAQKYLDIAGVMFVAINTKGEVTLINQKGSEILRYKQEEIIGKNWFDNFLPIILKNQVKLVFDRLMTGEIEPVEYYENPVFTKGDEERIIAWHNTTLKDDEGAIIGTLSSGEDITERKQAEEEKKKMEAQLQQAQKMEAIGTLAGGIAHDFNNLLQAISGFTEILLENKDPSDPDYESLKVIEQSSQKAADLIGQLLIFSRKVESELKPVVLNQQINKVSKLLERTIPKMISIEYNLAQDLKIINADPLQIEQVMMNLGINAKDVMPDGGRLIFETENITLDEQYCKTHPGASPGEYVLLSVSDTGHGMDKETLEHIFEPFYTTKEIGKGTGLGLPMVYGIVKSHGGYIMCYSEPGLGTTFKIYFPVLTIESLEPRAEEPRAEEPRAEALPGGRETILLVDDDATILEVGKAMLERHGYTTIMAESGERAIEIYGKEKEHIDLVILDVGMPGIGGHKCLERLLKVDPGIKVIIATGYAPSGKVKETLESGAAGYIRKPFLKADMLKRIREVLDKKQGL